jgi:hypothetical protein
MAMLPEAVQTCMVLTGCTRGAATATPSTKHQHSKTQRARARVLRRVCSKVIAQLWQAAILGR